MPFHIIGDTVANQIIGEILPEYSGKIEFVGRGAVLKIGKNTMLKQVNLRLDSLAKVDIGNDCHIEGQLRCNQQCVIQIGDRTRLLGASRLHAHEAVSICIGTDCILQHLRCRTSDSHKIYMQDQPQHRLNVGRGIQVGHRVYTEHAVHVYKGVVIGSDSYIRSHAVVVKPIPEGSYVSGVPAMIVRAGVVWFRGSN